MEPSFIWLGCHTVTVEIAGSSPVGSAIRVSLFRKNRVVERRLSPLILKNIYSSLKKERAGFSSERITCEYISRKSEGIIPINPERRSQHGLSEWKPYREQVMEWHNSVKVACGGFSRVSLDSNIDSNGMHRCKKITSLMAFMTKVYLCPRPSPKVRLQVVLGW